MLSLTSRSPLSSPQGTLDPSGVSASDSSGETNAVFDQSGGHASPSFQARLSAAVELGKADPQATGSQKGAAASSLPNEGDSLVATTNLVGKNLPLAGRALPQGIEGGDSEPIPEPSAAQVPFPVQTQDSPAVAQLLPGFSEPSDRAIPQPLAARFAENFERSDSDEAEEFVAINPAANLIDSPPSGSPEPSSQSAASQERLVGEFRGPPTEDNPTNQAPKLNPDESASAPQPARYGKRVLTATSVPPLVQSLTSPAWEVADAKGALALDPVMDSKVRNVIASSQQNGAQGPTASPEFDAELPRDLNEEKFTSHKTLMASPASSPIASSSAPSAPTTGPSFAALTTASAPVSPNAQSVAGTTIAPPHALVERFVEQVADAREAGRSIRPELTLRHGEFGQVGLRLEAGSSANIGEWRATLMARDPGFVPAVQAALGERISAASESGLSHNGAYSQRGNDNGSPSSGSNASGQSGSQSAIANGGGEQRYGSSTGHDQGSAKPYSGEEALSGSNTAAADILDTDSSEAADEALGTPGALFA